VLNAAREEERLQVQEKNEKKGGKQQRGSVPRRQDADPAGRGRKVVVTILLVKTLLGEGIGLIGFVFPFPLLLLLILLHLLDQTLLVVADRALVNLNRLVVADPNLLGNLRKRKQRDRTQSEKESEHGSRSDDDADCRCTIFRFF